MAGTPNGDDAARGFPLDDFQLQAIEAFDRGESVLVAAPTGAGKTVIAEHAIERMLASGQRVFYTSPIKALANQKFRDFSARYGAESLGLLTGDVSVRGDAQIVVMTTEVLRNMLYEQSLRLRSLGCVVLDEVHYLQDRARGPVWEEVLLNLPHTIRTVSLSATVSNVEEFVDWLSTVRGPTELVEERTRPVPLDHELAVADRLNGGLERVPLLDGKRLSRDASRFGSERSKRKGSRNRRGRHREPRTERRWASPRRSDLVDELVMSQKGPVIWFVFSRAGCEEAVDQCRRARLRYTTAEEADELVAILQEATKEIDDDDWYSLDLDDWQRSFEAGVTSHHAGLIPALKEAVETAFARGLIHAVFATETLALGVNLPARTVVLEKLIKYNGESHELLTPLEFTQLTGRAGRRGLDTRGTAVTCWNQRVPLNDVAALAASTDFPLRSAFSPNYNMVANLVRRADQESARRFVTRSFAQFQRDRTIVAQHSAVADIEQAIHIARAAAECEHGDVIDWLRRSESAARADDDELGQLRPGSVVAVAGASLVVSVAHRGEGIVVRTIDRGGRRNSFRRGELASPIPVLGVETLPVGVDPSSGKAVDWAVERLEAGWPSPAVGVEACADLPAHLEALDEVARLERQLAKRRARSDRLKGGLVKQFDEVADILHECDFATDWELTAKGEILAAVHGETEAVLAEAMYRDTLTGLDPAEFAAVVSVLVHERRGTGPAPSFKWPTRNVRKAVAELLQQAERLRVVEFARLGQYMTRMPDPGLVAVVDGWAQGEPLDAVLDDEMSGGDFVRSMRQVIDMCRQIAAVASGDLSVIALDAVAAIDRGVVRSARDPELEDLDAD